MIEVFSYTHLLNLQLDFLLWLQNIRIHHNELNQFLLWLTKFGEFYIPSLICLTIYWCISLIDGVYLFSLFYANVFFTQLIKMLACVYRPWILNDKIKPPAEAIRGAGGYSFPSGHSSKVASVFGGLAIIYKNKYLTTLVILLILSIMFSRMWLGVHTLQDVIIGFLIGIVLIFILKPFINWLEENKNRYFYIITIINILTVATVWYIRYKTYPMDYFDGHLIVNPNSSIYASLICLSYPLGLLNGVFLCRRFFPFNTDISIRKKVLRCILGILLLNFIFNIMNNYFWGISRNYLFTFCIMFLFGFTLTGIYPLIFTKIEKLYK
ncbi:MAG: phosphatase PAP2 family protein [bacterium]|nr:phosphatase PAP2 family protein [bacterium]